MRPATSRVTHRFYLEARKFINDLMTSWMGMFGPGCGPGQVTPSSGVTITGGTEFTVLPLPDDQFCWQDESESERFEFVNDLFISYVNQKLEKGVTN